MISNEKISKPKLIIYSSGLFRYQPIMKMLVILLLLICNSIVGQTGSILATQERIINLKESKTGILRIRTELKPSSQDTVLIYVEEILEETVSRLQTIESAYSFPLEINQSSINDQIGILVKYDPAVRNGNQFLFLLDQEAKRLQPVSGYWNLGMIQSIEYAGKTYNYSYATCGCADNCWKSVLFEIQDFKLISNNTLACDCEKLIRSPDSEDKEFPSTCQEFNNSEKFEKIERYWRTLLKEK